MMQQYMDIKKQYKDEILFYRIGDFYEMFFDDALTASRELDLTLTGKQCGMEERAPMCGVPFHSYEGYVARLIAKGYKVAICEQVEDPAKAKGLVKRDIIRVVTPGTVIESSMLQDDRNNYIASLYLKGKKAGLCFADVSTGTAHITELAADKIAPAVITELCRYHPSEVLLNPGLLDCREVTAYIKKNMSCSVELVEDERYAPGLVPWQYVQVCGVVPSFAPVPWQVLQVSMREKVISRSQPKAASSKLISISLTTFWPLLGPLLRPEDDEAPPPKKSPKISPRSPKPPKPPPNPPPKPAPAFGLKFGSTPAKPY